MSVAQAGQVAIEIVESDDDALRIGIAAQVVVDQEDTRIGHCQMFHLGMLPEKTLQGRICLVGLFGMDEQRMDAALGKCLLDVVEKTVTARCIRVGLVFPVANQSDQRDILHLATGRKQKGSERPAFVGVHAVVQQIVEVVDLVVHECVGNAGLFQPLRERDDLTYEELQQFALVDRHRKETPYKIPRLKDMLEWGKDRVVFNFDNKYVNTKGVSDRVRRASIDYYIRQLQPGGDWAEYHNIVLSVRSLDEALRYWNSGIRQVMFCVEISSRADFEAYDASPIPWRYIMAYIRTAVDPRLQEVYDLLHARGVMTMTSIVETSDKVKNARDRNTAYLRELLAEPDIIETDYPSEFVELPRSRREIHALQDCALRSRSRK